MTKTTPVAVWLLIFIVGLPIFSETVYTPSLPDIATSLATSETLVEYTLTIYLFAFAIGTMFWGKISDSYGRRPCVILGFAIYIIGCLSCYFSTSIEMLMLSRFIQAFGGSVGSVLGQAIARDAFHGPALGKIYASVGAAIAVFPAIGPVIGGFVAQYFGWSATFIMLTITGTILLGLICINLMETHAHESRKRVNTFHLALRMLKDPKVVCCGLLIGSGNGINFSYFAEAPFYLISLLGLSPIVYGLTFLATSGAYMLGNMISKRLHEHHQYHTIMGYGAIILVIGASIFILLTLIGANKFPAPFMAAIAVSSMMIISAGIAMLISNSLYISLTEYRDNSGTASSIFGLFYYLVISVITLGMGYIHNKTLIPMPVYFFSIAIFMFVVFKLMIRYSRN